MFRHILVTTYEEFLDRYFFGETIQEIYCEPTQAEIERVGELQAVVDRVALNLGMDLRPSNLEWGPGLTWFIANSGDGRAYFLRGFNLLEEQTIFAHLTSKKSVV